MKLSSETIAVLKNFSSINQGIQFKKGKKLSTVSSGKTVLAQANLKDEFPQEFCIYDLNEFLSIYNFYKDSEIDFTDSDVIFNPGGKRSGYYRMTAKEMIVTPPEKEITLPSVDCEFNLTVEDYDALLKSASLVSSPNIGVRSDGEKVELITFDANNDAAHINKIEVGVGNGSKYTIAFKTENIKLISGNYVVKVSFKGIAHFKNTKDDIQYWIAFEAKDTKIGE